MFDNQRRPPRNHGCRNTKAASRYESLSRLVILWTCRTSFPRRPTFFQDHALQGAGKVQECDFHTSRSLHLVAPQCLLCQPAEVEPGAKSAHILGHNAVFFGFYFKAFMKILPPTISVMQILASSVDHGLFLLYPETHCTPETSQVQSSHAACFFQPPLLLLLLHLLLTDVFGWLRLSPAGP